MDQKRKQYRDLNRRKINAQKRAWYAKNKDRINEDRKEWRAQPKNKATVAEYRARYQPSTAVRKKQGDRARERARKLKSKAVTILGDICKVCGLQDHPAVYDFHHKEPSEKDFNVSRNLNRKPWDKIEQELKKCELVCANCHRKLHVL